MAIQPLDLQTLFTQLDKVGKLQNAEKEGLAVQQSLQSAHVRKKTEEQVQSVDETKQAGEGAEAINDRNARKKSGDQSGGEKREKNASEEKKMRVFRDPTLGKNIDLSF